jgi:autotransporter-associated beta strand protein
MNKIVALLASALLLSTIAAGTARAQFTWATDNAANYGGSWTNGSNAGSGFGAWGFSVGANTGNFIGNPANDGMGTTGIGTTTFGLFATGNQYFNGGRAFTSPMQVGDSFTFWWAMNFDANGGGKGIDLKANNTTIFNINNGGSATITTSNGTADTVYGTTPMLVTATRLSGTHYGFSMTSRSGGATYSTTFSSTTALDSFNLYIGNQNNGAGQRNIYFNTFQVANSGTYSSGGTVTESRALTGGGGLTVSGSTTLDLTSTGNTFSGGSTVNAGSTLRIGTGGANGSLAGNVVNNGSLTFNSTSVTSYGGQITGSGTLTKSAGGALAVTGNSSSYAGATLVQAGTLAVNGSLGGSVSVSVNAILSGTGTIGGNASIAGTLNPGGTAAVGTQTFNGNLTYAAGSILSWELFANNALGGSYDQIVVPTGNLTFSGSTSVAMSFNGAGSAVAWSNPFWNVSRSWLVQDLGSGVINNFGNLSISTQNWLDSTGAAFNTARPGSSFTLIQQGQDVLITYVPEPSMIAIVITGLASVVVCGARRRGAG